MDCLVSASSSKKRYPPASDSDSDGAPEVLSMVAGKKQIKQKESEIDKFAKATAKAQRQANRLRDEKLKKNSKARKTKALVDTAIHSVEKLSSDEEDEEVESNQIGTTITQKSKKYLDPSLFASASQILEQSKKASKILESEKSKLELSRRKKYKKFQNQSSRDIGNNTTVVHLSQSEHISLAPRPIAASNFERNRLYPKPSRSRVRLPKSTLAAKMELGSRKSTIDLIHARRAQKPAVVFTKS